MKRRTNFLNYAGKFELKTCAAIRDYIFSKTGIEVEVNRSESYLTITYIKDVVLNCEKIKIPASVLYCLDEDDFAPLFEKMNKTSDGLTRVEKSLLFDFICANFCEVTIRLHDGGQHDIYPDENLVEKLRQCYKFNTMKMEEWPL